MMLHVGRLDSLVQIFSLRCLCKGPVRMTVDLRPMNIQHGTKMIANKFMAQDKVQEAREMLPCSGNGADGRSCPFDAGNVAPVACNVGTNGSTGVLGGCVIAAAATLP